MVKFCTEQWLGYKYNGIQKADLKKSYFFFKSMKHSNLFNDIRLREFNNVSVSANALCMVFDWLLDHVLDALGNICFEALNASTECKM